MIGLLWGNVCVLLKIPWTNQRAVTLIAALCKQDVRCVHVSFANFNSCSSFFYPLTLSLRVWGRGVKLVSVLGLLQANYLKMIIRTQSFQFPHVNQKTPYHWEVCQLTVIKTSGSDEINCPDNHLHDVIHFQRLATKCLLVRNTVKCPQFTSSTYNLYFSPNFVATPAFFPIIDGALFVAILAARD